jgi:hypothetical protein
VSLSGEVSLVNVKRRNWLVALGWPARGYLAAGGGGLSCSLAWLLSFWLLNFNNCTFSSFVSKYRIRFVSDDAEGGAQKKPVHRWNSS